MTVAKRARRSRASQKCQKALYASSLALYLLILASLFNSVGADATARLQESASLHKSDFILTLDSLTAGNFAFLFEYLGFSLERPPLHVEQFPGSLPLPKQDTFDEDASDNVVNQEAPERSGPFSDFNTELIVDIVEESNDNNNDNSNIDFNTDDKNINDRGSEPNEFDSAPDFQDNSMEESVIDNQQRLTYMTGFSAAAETYHTRPSYNEPPQEKTVVSSRDCESEAHQNELTSPVTKAVDEKVDARAVKPECPRKCNHNHKNTHLHSPKPKCNCQASGDLFSLYTFDSEFYSQLSAAIFSLFLLPLFGSLVRGFQRNRAPVYAAWIPHSQAISATSAFLFAFSFDMMTSSRCLIAVSRLPLFFSSLTVVSSLFAPSLSRPSILSTEVVYNGSGIRVIEALLDVFAVCTGALASAVWASDLLPLISPMMPALLFYRRRSSATYLHQNTFKLQHQVSGYLTLGLTATMAALLRRFKFSVPLMFDIFVTLIAVSILLRVVLKILRTSYSPSPMSSSSDFARYSPQSDHMSPFYNWDNSETIENGHPFLRITPETFEFNNTALHTESSSASPTNSISDSRTPVSEWQNRSVQSQLHQLHSFNNNRGTPHEGNGRLRVKLASTAETRSKSGPDFAKTVAGISRRMTDATHSMASKAELLKPLSPPKQQASPIYVATTTQQFVSPERVSPRNVQLPPSRSPQKKLPSREPSPNRLLREGSKSPLSPRKQNQVLGGNAETPTQGPLRDRSPVKLIQAGPVPRKSPNVQIFGFPALEKEETEAESSQEISGVSEAEEPQAKMVLLAPEHKPQGQPKRSQSFAQNTAKRNASKSPPLDKKKNRALSVNSASHTTDEQESMTSSTENLQAGSGAPVFKRQRNWRKSNSLYKKDKSKSPPKQQQQQQQQAQSQQE